MATNINRLLKKKGWTGKDAGKLLVYSLIHDIKENQNPNAKALFAQSDFDKIVNSLDSKNDFLTYEIYLAIHNGVQDTNLRAHAMLQQFYHGHYRYYNNLLLCYRTDNAMREAESRPLIMTQTQYNRHRENAQRKLKQLTESINSLLFHSLAEFIEHPQQAPTQITAAIEATKQEQATNKRILANYNEYMHLGYYILPNGKRSDEMGEKEWKAAVKQAFLEKHKFKINGRDATADETLKEYRLAEAMKAYELFFKGIPAIKEAYKGNTGNELDLSAEDEVLLLEEIENIFISLGNQSIDKSFDDTIADITDPAAAFSKPKWKYYAEPPKGLTKYDLLVHCLDRYEGHEEDGTDEKQQLKEFKADYPELHKELMAYIKETIPQAKDLKANQSDKDFVTWGELAELDYANYKTLIVPSKYDIIEEFTEADTLENYSKRQRIMWNGITILQEPEAEQVDENGDYIESGADPLSFYLSLDYLAEEETQLENIPQLQTRLMIPALRYIYALNELLKIIADVYDLAELKNISIDTFVAESQVHAANEILYSFYAQVYGNKEEKQRKREIIKKLYAPIDVKTLKPTKEAIEKVRAEIEGIGFSLAAHRQIGLFNGFIAKLSARGE